MSARLVSPSAIKEVPSGRGRNIPHRHRGHEPRRHRRRAGGRASLVPGPLAGERVSPRADTEHERAVHRRARRGPHRRLRGPLAHGGRGSHHDLRRSSGSAPATDRRTDARACLRDGGGAQRRVADARSARFESRGAEALREIRISPRRCAPPVLLGQQRGRSDYVDRAAARPRRARPGREAQGPARGGRLRILAIETSCDETGVAIVEDGRRIRSNVVASQLVHQDTGGIVPEVAAREHLRALDALTVKALADAGCQLSEIDAVARLLHLGFPGGPIIERIAKEGDPNAFPLPRAALADRFDFSFSGLKTAVLRLVRELEKKGDVPVADVAASFQKAITEMLSEKTARAAAEHAVETVLLGGGVAANLALPAEIARRIGHPPRVPPPRLCTDNRAMIGPAAFFALPHPRTEIPGAVRSDMKLA